MAAKVLMEISKDEHERARLRSRKMAETKKPVNIIPIFTAVCMILTLFTACGSDKTNAKTNNESTSAGTYRMISGSRAQKLFNDSGAVIVDVRSKAEYDERHVKGAVLMPHDIVQTMAPRALSDKNSTIIVYCRTGRRTKLAANSLFSLGYKNVYDMGGIGNWPGEFEPSGR